MHFVYPQICITIVFDFSWVGNCYVFIFFFMGGGGGGGGGRAGLNNNGGLSS